MPSEAILQGNTFGNTSELALIRDAARGFLRNRGTISTVPDAGKMLRDTWRRACEQGWSTLSALGDEAWLASALVLIEETGRAACPLPILDTVLLNAVLASSEHSEDAESWLPRIQTGEVFPSLILADDCGLHFSTVDDAGRIDGTVSFVEHAAAVTHFMLPTGRINEFAIVAADAAGLSKTFTPGLCVPALADIRFENVGTAAILRSAFDAATLKPLARLMLAARALGAASRGLEMLTDYAKVRTQFGKVIGQYQAIQHKLANCLMGLEVCRLSILRAGTSTEKGDLVYSASVAASCCGHVLRQVCLEIHHGFGGVSFWEEHEMPRHFRRIHGDLSRFGGLHASRGELADKILGKVVK